MRGMTKIASMLLCSTALLAQPAFAQDQTGEEQDNGQIQEIVVTAQRRAESLMKVPVAVTAIT